MQADLAGVSATAATSNLDDLRAAHAHQYASQLLGQVDLGPVATNQQTVSAGGTDFSTSSTVTLGINDQANQNAMMSAQQMRSMGFSEDAIVRVTQEVKVRTYSVQGETQFQQTPGEDIEQSGGAEQRLGLPNSQRQGIRAGIEEELHQPIDHAMADGLADPEADVNEWMNSLSTQIDQDTSVAAVTANEATIAADFTIEDPLENSPFMKIETGLDQGMEVTQATGTDVATGSRFDLSFADQQAAAAPQAEPVAMETQPGLRFDYQADAAPGTAQTQNAGFDTPLGPALAIAPLADQVFKLARGTEEEGRSVRNGRERQTVYSVAA